MSRWSKFSRGAARAFQASVAATDGRDVMLVAGLGLASYGLAQIYLPAAFILPGAVLAYVAIFGVQR